MTVTGDTTRRNTLATEELRHLVEEALAAFGQEDFEGALELAERAVAQGQDYAPAVHVLGLLAYRLDEPVRALHLFEVAHNIAPAVFEHAEMLGIVNARLGRLPESLYYGKLAGVLEKSDLPGLIPAIMGTFGEHFMSIEERPLLRAGKAALAAGQYDVAVQSFEKQIQLDPRSVDGHRNLVRALTCAGDLYRAATTAVALGQLAGGQPEDLSMTAHILARLDRHSQSRACHNRAVAAEPDNAALAMARIGDMTLDVEQPRAAVAEALRAWALKFAEPDLLPPAPVASGLDKRPVRVGFVGHEFCAGSEVDFMLATINRHARDNCRIYCYSNNPRDDETTPAFRNAAYAWCDITEMDDDTVALVIRNDGIDVLVDLSGTRPGHRAALFAMRPAAVQLSLFGLPEAAAALGFDGVLGDTVTYPDGASAGDGVYRVAAGLTVAPAANLLPARTRDPEEPVVFGVLAGRGRLNAGVLVCWTEILKGIPGARLLVDPARLGGLDGVDEVLSQLAMFGVQDRVDFLTDAAPETYDEELIQKIDVLLDPWPAQSPATVRAAIAAGTPVIVMANPLPEHRTMASMLTHMGLRELVAETPQAYVAAAVAAAASVDDARARVARALGANRDDAAVSNQLEAIYRQAAAAKVPA